MVVDVPEWSQSNNLGQGISHGNYVSNTEVWFRESSGYINKPETFQLTTGISIKVYDGLKGLAILQSKQFFLSLSRGAEPSDLCLPRKPVPQSSRAIARKQTQKNDDQQPVLRVSNRTLTKFKTAYIEACQRGRSPKLDSKNKNKIFLKKELFPSISNKSKLVYTEEDTQINRAVNQ